MGLVLGSKDWAKPSHIKIKPKTILIITVLMGIRITINN